MSLTLIHDIARMTCTLAAKSGSAPKRIGIKV